MHFTSDTYDKKKNPVYISLYVNIDLIKRLKFYLPEKSSLTQVFITCNFSGVLMHFQHASKSAGLNVPTF